MLSYKLKHNSAVHTREMHLKNYEISDHLGNVRAVVSDLKEPSTLMGDVLLRHYDFNDFSLYNPSGSGSYASFWVGNRGGELKHQNDGRIRVDRKNSGTDDVFIMRGQQYSTIIGQQYKLTVDFDTDGNHNAVYARAMSVSPSSVIASASLNLTVGNIIELTFTATSTSTILQVYGQSSDTTRHFFVDNTTLVKVGAGGPSEFEPVVATISNYYPFGSPMPGRNASSGDYRYGFNGMEKDDEIKGNGNSYDFNFRIFDSRIGKFFSVDPLASNYSSQSPYHFAGNTPIQAIDLEGLELFLVNGYDGVSNKTKDAAKSVDLAKMIKYWNNNNPSFITDVAVYFKEKDLRFLDGSQGGLSHGDVSKRYLKGYKTALKLVKNNQVDFSKDITIVGHSQGAAYSAGMAEAFLNIIEKLNTNVDEKININVNVILLAPDGAEQFTVDERANSLQLNYGDDYVVTDNKATVGNVDVDANPDRVEAFPFLTKSIKKGLKAHSAPIDSPGALKSALNKAKGLFNKKK